MGSETGPCNMSRQPWTRWETHFSAPPLIHFGPFFRLSHNIETFVCVCFFCFGFSRWDVIPDDILYLCHEVPSGVGGWGDMAVSCGTVPHPHPTLWDAGVISRAGGNACVPWRRGWGNASRARRPRHDL